MLMPVHDEVVFEIKEDKLDFYIPELCEIMAIKDLVEALAWPVPFEVDAEYGDSFHVDHNYWKERKALGQSPKPVVAPAPKTESTQVTAPSPTPIETTPVVTNTNPESEKEAAGNPTKESVLRVDTATVVLETPPSQEAHTTSSGEFIHFAVTVREAVMAAAEKAKLKFEQSESEAFEEALKDVRIKDRIDHRGVLIYPIERLDPVTLHQFDTVIRILVNYGDALFVGPKCKVDLVDKATGEVWYESTKKVSVDAFLALCLWLKI
jgi:hypothetical protein